MKQYKIENLIAADEGKSILLNGNIIPSSAGVKFEDWMYNWKVNKVGIKLKITYAITNGNENK